MTTHGHARKIKGFGTFEIAASDMRQEELAHRFQIFLSNLLARRTEFDLAHGFHPLIQVPVQALRPICTAHMYRAT